jgi:glucosamine--fructose-6-phosphate aminotransferase (isomerizing)
VSQLTGATVLDTFEPVETAFEREIRDQPHVIAGMIARERSQVEAIAAEVRRRRPRFALIAARGSSDNAARYAKYLFGARHRLAVGLAAPALYTMYGASPDVSDALVIGVSQSGESPDVVAVVEDAARQGALTVALTNEPGSPLARAAAMCLALGAGEERAVAASKTYSSQLCAFSMLSAALGEDEQAWRELAAIPDAMRSALDAAGAARAGAPSLRGASRIAVLGRGFNFATAFEAALKLKETCYLAAEPYSWADFLHGPIAMLDQLFPVLLIAPSGAASVDAADIAAILAERGALSAVVSDRDDLLSRAAIQLRLPSAPDWLTPLVAILPCQLLALSLALAKNHDPDAPRGLHKVTRTR